MCSVRKLLKDIIDIEGDYTNNHYDFGGPTRYGITETVARLYGYTGDMKNFPIEMAYEIYEKRYVKIPNFNEVLNINYELGFELIDTGINMGPGTASAFLQRWLNGFNSQGKYPDLFVDSRIGTITLNSLKVFLDWRGESGKIALLRGLNSVQGARYLQITENNRTQREFLFGWILNRVEI